MVGVAVGGVPVGVGRAGVAVAVGGADVGVAVGAPGVGVLVGVAVGVAVALAAGLNGALNGPGTGEQVPVMMRTRYCRSTGSVPNHVVAAVVVTTVQFVVPMSWRCKR